MIKIIRTRTHKLNAMLGCARVDARIEAGMRQCADKSERRGEGDGNESGKVGGEDRAPVAAARRAVIPAQAGIR
ncbi:MAG: hypothetical protein ABW069_19785 [Duganella sp.]